MQSCILLQQNKRFSFPMYQTRWILLIAFLAFTCNIFAQSGVVWGIVKNAQSRELIPGAHIVSGEKLGTTSLPDGTYSLKLPYGNYIIESRFIGFGSGKKNIVVNRDSIRVDFHLTEKITQLGTMVVSASRFEQDINEVTVSMDVLKPGLIENTNSTSLDEALEYVPGLNITDGQASIRSGSGFSYGAGSRVMIMVDGMPMLTGDAGDVKWSFLPVEDLAQVEIIKGAASALYGSSALNGVINLRTTFPGSEPFLNVTTFSGVYDNPSRKELKWWDGMNPQITGFQFNHGRKIGVFDLVLGGNMLNDEGYRKGESESRKRISVKSRYRVNKIPGLAVTARTSIQQAEGASFLIWGNASDSAYIPLPGSMSRYRNTRYSNDVSLNYINMKGTGHRILTRYFLTQNDNNTNQSSSANVLFGEYQFQKNFLKLVMFTGGINTMGKKVESQLYGDHNGHNTAFFVQTDLKKGKTTFSAGSRWEQNSVDKSSEPFKGVYRSGLNYQLMKHTHLRASAGQGYRFPTIAEKYVKTNVGSIYVYPNDSLEPETGWSAEAGIRQGYRIGSWKGNLDAAWFYTRYQNMMEFIFGQFGDPFRDPFFGIGFRSENIGNSTIKGVDVSVNGDVSYRRWQISAQGGYTFSDPRQNDFDPAFDTLKNTSKTDVLKYRHRHLMKGDLEIKFRNIYLGGSVRYMSFMENVDIVFENQLFLKGVKEYRKVHDQGDYVFDGRIGWRLNEHANLSLIVKNILNHEYMGRPADMQPMRSFMMQAAVKM
jgi:outer membrane cobalamin receptor